MIIYFSGTGNSFSLAKKLSERLNDTLVPLKRANNDGSKRIVFVFPLYCEDIPPNVRKFIKEFELEKSQEVMGICTSGGGTGNAEYTFNKLIEEKDMKVKRFMTVPMIDNSFPAFFGSDVSNHSINEDRVIDNFINMIYTNKSNNNPMNKLGEFLVFNPVSKRLLKKKVDVDLCNGCKVCSQICPNDNIEMIDGKAKINKECTECFGCVHACPKQAIYIRKKINKSSQYTNRNIRLNELNQ